MLESQWMNSKWNLKMLNPKEGSKRGTGSKQKTCNKLIDVNYIEFLNVVNTSI